MLSTLQLFESRGTNTCILMRACTHARTRAHAGFVKCLLDLRAGDAISLVAYLNSLIKLLALVTREARAHAFDDLVTGVHPVGHFVLWYSHATLWTRALPLATAGRAARTRLAYQYTCPLSAQAD